MPHQQSVKLSTAKVEISPVFSHFCKKKQSMLLPYQRYYFLSGDTIRELHRKFQLMMDQRTAISRRVGLFKKGDVPNGIRYSGTMEGNRFQITPLKHNGDEDIATIHGEIDVKDHQLRIAVQTRFTGSYLMQTVGSIVVVMVAVYMYAYIGVNLFKAQLPEGFMMYLIALLLTVWINMRRYSQKVTALLEELMEWLELSEEG